MSGIDHQTDGYFFAPATPLGKGSVRAYYERLLKGLGHHLNNQTSVVHGFASLLLMRDDLSEETRENLIHIKRSGEESSLLVGRVLTLTGHSRASPVSLQVNAFFRMLDGSLRQLFATAGVPLEIQVQPNLPAIECDPSQLRELLFEILRNACEAAASGGGQVAIDVFAPGKLTPADERRVDLFIRNSGAGFPPEMGESSFEPFVSGKQGGHFGLGLCVAAVLASDIGARLGIAANDGTTRVWLSIPAADQTLFPMA